MQWIVIVLSMNASGHPYIANSSWMDTGGYPSLEACQADLPRQMALHPQSQVVTGGAAALWECLAVDFSQSKTLIPNTNGSWK
jgi:hypothetical protein